MHRTSKIHRSLVTLALIILPLAAIGWHEWTTWPDGKVHLAFLAIGQGDSALIVTPRGHQIIIDGGPDLRTLEHLGKRMSLFDRSVDLLILTHPHLDHLASFPEILERYDVKRVMLAGSAYALPRYDYLLHEVRARSIEVIDPALHRSVVLDGVKIDFLWPANEWWGKTASNIHDSSLVFQVSYGDHTALFTGDIEEKTEKLLVRSGLPLRADVLKVAHHGSRTSSSRVFLQAVRPELAVISLGEHNRYGHPHAEVLERFAALGIPVKRTDREGVVEIVWDGETPRRGVSTGFRSE